MITVVGVATAEVSVLRLERWTLCWKPPASLSVSPALEQAVAATAEVAATAVVAEAAAEAVPAPATGAIAPG